MKNYTIRIPLVVYETALGKLEARSFHILVTVDAESDADAAARLSEHLTNVLAHRPGGAQMD